MKKIFLFGMFLWLISVAIVLNGCEFNDMNNLSEFEKSCISLDGNWIDLANECEYISKNDCESLGGNFNECASACRNDPDAEMCTMQCVSVCEFN